jgi:hypothetical protein
MSEGSRHGLVLRGTVMERKKGEINRREKGMYEKKKKRRKQTTIEK